MFDLDGLENAVISLAEQAGFNTRLEKSGKSQSRYIFISRQGVGFDAPKSVRRFYCAEVGPFPRFSGLCVRVSDHHGYGDGSTVHISVRADLDAAKGLAKVARALQILGAGRTQAAA